MRRTTAERLPDDTLAIDELQDLNPLLAKLLAHLEQAFGTAPRHGALRTDDQLHIVRH